VAFAQDHRSAASAQYASQDPPSAPAARGKTLKGSHGQAGGISLGGIHFAAAADGEPAGQGGRIAGVGEHATAVRTKPDSRFQLTAHSRPLRVANIACSLRPVGHALAGHLLPEEPERDNLWAGSPRRQAQPMGTECRRWTRTGDRPYIGTSLAKFTTMTRCERRTEILVVVTLAWMFLAVALSGAAGFHKRGISVLVSIGLGVVGALLIFVLTGLALLVVAWIIIRR
jgi:hypothetical protein